MRPAEPEPGSEPELTTRVEQHPARGDVLVASRAFRPGQMLIDEPPLLLVRADGSWHSTTPEGFSASSSADGA